MRTLASILTAAALTACAVGPDYHAPDAKLAAAFVNTPPHTDVTPDADWWRGFDDPILLALLDQAAANNTDIAQAAARIAQSRAAVRGATAALLPGGGVTSSVTRSRQSLETPIGAASRILDLPRSYSEYEGDVQASWELDVFGGLRRGREAARADAAAIAANAGAVQLAVAADTADAYLTIRQLQARLGVAEAQERAAAQLADLVRQRVEHGLAPDRDFSRASAELDSVRAQMAPLRAALEAQLNRIDVLTGRQPGAGRTMLIARQSIPAAPLPATNATPTDLLRRRPDVVAAEHRLAAANARIGVSLAEYYPHVSLAGLVGTATVTSGALFTGNTVQASGAAGLRWRLFDFARIDAEVGAARGRQAEALAAWRGSVLRAAEDVENALVQLRETHVEYEALKRAEAALTSARDQTQLAYGNGVAPLIDALDADRTLLTTSDRLASARAAESRAAVAVYRALGGAWQGGSATPLALAAGSAR